MKRTSIFGEVLRGIGGIGEEILRQTLGVKTSHSHKSKSGGDRISVHHHHYWPKKKEWIFVNYPKRKK